MMKYNNYTFIHICMYVCMYVCIYTHTYIHMYIFKLWCAAEFKRYRLFYIKKCVCVIENDVTVW